ncbi:peptidase A2 [Aphanothece hegewaldii CCALA 016]|uniref:Peptidase A2 n=1 Tax=Aphanothece hegewaldii CCALA 016 TaxID=2107694 RepID=A0A2T1LVL5_9CHRO|nr:retropepsin-like aspartic protease [Aphanothece hegewaldii]PSF35764.1 peptidase A2 [Aphanothece hegewaldii CCALA 016]
MIIHPYQKIGNIDVPLIKIEFANPSNWQLSLSEYSLLDTGADITLFPYFLINNLVLRRIRKPSRTTVKGFNNKLIEAVPYLISFSFDSENFYDSVIYDLPEIELREIIIGRDILNRFCVKFDGIHQRIIINS